MFAIQKYLKRELSGCLNFKVLKFLKKTVCTGAFNV